MNIILKIYILLAFILLAGCKTNCEQAFKDGYKNGFNDGVKSASDRNTNTGGTNKSSNYKKQNNSNIEISNAKANSKVLEVLQYIKQNKAAPKGFVGGRQFMNFEKLLPEEDENGNKIIYQEWDVNPKTNGRNRGRERLVTGSNGFSYYTSNHYKSFQRIQE